MSTLDFTSLTSTLQTKIDTTTDPKELLLVGKAIESTIGSATVSDIQAEGQVQIQAIQDAGGTYLQVSNNLSDLDNVSTARSNLGLSIGTDVQAFDANTAKLDVAQTFSAEQTFAETKETVYTISGTTPSIDPANGSVQEWTLTANSTPTHSIESGQSVVLHVNGGATYTVTWPSVTWSSGTAPTLTASDVLVFWNVSGTLYGAYVGTLVAA